MRYKLKLDICHGDGENGLRDAVAELLFSEVYQVRPGFSWSETGVRSGGGWPEVEFHGHAVDLIALVHNYVGGGVEQDGGQSLLEILQQIEPLVEKTREPEDLTDDYVASEGRQLRPGGRDFHL